MILARTIALSVFCLLCWGTRAQEIGLQLNSLRGQFETDAAGAMAKVKAMGISQVEMNGTHGLSFPEFIKLLASNGISVVSFQADYEKLTTFPQVVADEARSYGARFIVCSLDQRLVNAQSPDKTAEALNHAGKIIARNGMLLCYQPSSQEFTSANGKMPFDYIVTKLDSRYVHFEMDVLSVRQGGQDPVAVLKKYPSRFVLLQLKDGKAGRADNESNVPLGTGDVGIKAVFETARELGIRYYFIEDESSKSEKQLPKSLAYIKALGARETAKK